MRLCLNTHTSSSATRIGNNAAAPTPSARPPRIVLTLAVVGTTYLFAWADPWLLLPLPGGRLDQVARVEVAAHRSMPNPSRQHDAAANDSATIFRSEAELARYRPESFRRMSDLDPDLDNVTWEYRYLFDGALGGLVTLLDAYVSGPHAIAFNINTTYLPRGCKTDNVTDDQILSRIDWANTDEDSVAPGIRSATASRAKVVRELDTAVVIAQFWGESYYHAMTEDLPRLAFVFNVLESEYPNATILSYPQSLITPRSRGYLWNNLLGLPHGQKWEPYGDDVTYHARTLVIPTATRCGHGQPGALRLLRDRIFANAPHVLRDTIDRFHARHPGVLEGERTIIAVQWRAYRRLLNHDDLVAALASEFSNACTAIEFFGNETMEETIVLHHNAGIIVGPHGAGLSNILFARSDTAVIEIHPVIADGTGLNFCHQRTAKALGLKSTMLVQGRAKNYWDSFEADVPAIVGVVRELLDGIA